MIPADEYSVSFIDIINENPYIMFSAVIIVCIIMILVLIGYIKDLYEENQFLLECCYKLNAKLDKKEGKEDD